MLVISPTYSFTNIHKIIHQHNYSQFRMPSPAAGLRHMMHNVVKKDRFDSDTLRYVVNYAACFQITSGMFRIDYKVELFYD